MRGRGRVCLGGVKECLGGAGQAVRKKKKKNTKGTKGK